MEQKLSNHKLYIDSNKKYMLSICLQRARMNNLITLIYILLMMNNFKMFLNIARYVIKIDRNVSNIKRI